MIKNKIDDGFNPELVSGVLFNGGRYYDNW